MYSWDNSGSLIVTNDNDTVTTSTWTYDNRLAMACAGRG